MMCVRMHVTARHNVGKAAYYTDGPYKKNVFSSAFGILLTV